MVRANREDFKRNPEIEAFSRFLRRPCSTRARTFGRTYCSPSHARCCWCRLHDGETSRPTSGMASAQPQPKAPRSTVC